MDQDEKWSNAVSGNPRWLRGVSLFETVSLVVLVGNRLTMGYAGLASLVGPLHGTAYLATIAIGFSAGLSRRARWLCVVPGVGGLLALRAPRSPLDSGHPLPDVDGVVMADRVAANFPGAELPVTARSQGPRP
ncbi:hypothetical protein [Streptomyces sp. 150FB]|uniref:hypothetical protein n=1 Tax=Streptomyces sp. 150FB TaxID=1576605 RepID=UPI0007C6C934|nr:hypothetical protein [Streptomyces sp. 150FB]